MNRRDFIGQSVAAGVVATSSPASGRAKGAVRVKSLHRRDDTVRRYAGIGDGLTMTWAADDRQLVALQDGVGWGSNWLENKPAKGLYNSRLLVIDGSPQDATFLDLPGYPEIINGGDDRPLYYGFGTLALEGGIYQFLSTMNPLNEKEGGHWIGAKLIYSSDNGCTWRNQKGSMPVVWEPWDERSLDTMTFFQESQDAFSLLTFLQMGRNYEYNRDGYVYVYSPNGNTNGTMNELVMFRAPKTRILDRTSYEYFAGLSLRGGAHWASDMDARVAVCKFPHGWVNRALPGQNVVESWLPTVSYIAPLDLYLMGNYGAGPAPDGGFFGKPSYLGFWIAPHPWGPWSQIHEEAAWTPEGDADARAFDLQIAPKWIAADGKSFWLGWADLKGYEGLGQLGKEGKRIASPEDQGRYLRRMAEIIPNYRFNLQRVDLVVA